MIVVIDFGSTKAPLIAEMVDEFMDIILIPFSEFSEDDLNGIDGVILSGAPLLITEIDMSPYLRVMQWIKTSTIPILGICFGHQLIGLLFGAFASMIKPDRDWQTIESFEPSPLFDRLPQEFQMMQDHCEAISIPANFTLIASSDACVNEMMQHKNAPIFGVQFHPEVSGNHGRVLIENFLKVCTTQK